MRQVLQYQVAHVSGIHGHRRSMIRHAPIRSGVRLTSRIDKCRADKVKSFRTALPPDLLACRLLQILPGSTTGAYAILAQSCKQQRNVMSWTWKSLLFDHDLDPETYQYFYTEGGCVMIGLASVRSRSASLRFWLSKQVKIGQDLERAARCRPSRSVRQRRDG